MKTKKVSSVMIPLDQYATVFKDATLYEAIMALEKAQNEFVGSKYPHRAILVYDENKQIIGKISQLDVIRALEPLYGDMMEKGDSMIRFGFTKQFQKSLMEQFRLWNEPFNDICRKAVEKKVTDFMYTPDEGEFVEAEATLNEAVHQLIMGHHQSLLVTEKGKIVGILRLTDVFKEVVDVISTSCETP